MLRARLDASNFCRKEKCWRVGYIRDKWNVDEKTDETGYEQWLSKLTSDGKIAVSVGGK